MTAENQHYRAAVATQWVKPTSGMPTSHMGTSWNSQLLHFQSDSQLRNGKKQQNSTQCLRPTIHVGDPAKASDSALVLVATCTVNLFLCFSFFLYNSDFLISLLNAERKKETTIAQTAWKVSKCVSNLG